MTQTLFEFASVTIAQQARCQDHVAVFEFAQRVVIVVSDGAGGIGDGERASAYVVSEVRNRLLEAAEPATFERLLSQIDMTMPAGEATAVVLELTSDRIIGASVGDSQAWIVNDGTITNLTASQVRKPLLGSGEARVVGFDHGALTGTLIVATDGFCNYVPQAKIGPTIATAWFPVLATELSKLVRLPSGQLWDDVGIVVARRRSPGRTRVKRYEL